VLFWNFSISRRLILPADLGLRRTGCSRTCGSWKDFR